MTQAVVTRRDGDVFQARLFWLKAARLLDDEGNIERVGFESGPRGFDDIWVQYEPRRAPKNQYGEPILIERMQCKWHATPGAYSYADLVEPAFINATTTSVLQRAYASMQFDRAQNWSSKQVLVTNHKVREDDALRPILRMKSFTLDIDGLFKGKTNRSATYRVRRLWCDHLGIDENELRQLCVRLGLAESSESLDMLRERLDDACRLAGLVRPDPQSSSTIYDANIFEWVGQRRTEFDRKTLREKCGDEGLLAKPTPSRRVYGVKSFEHPFDRLEDRCAEVLNLVSEFEERFIRNTSSWRYTLQPRLREFLSKLPMADGRLTLAMDTHATLAFAAGAILDTKSGRLVDFLQRTPNPKVWSPDDQPVSPSWPMWNLRELSLDPNGAGTACAIGISRKAEDSVRQYAERELPGLRRLLVAELNVPPGQATVTCGAHANELAERLAERLQHDREASATALKERLHLFLAGPNAFALFLGRHAQVLKPLTLYEYDFGRERHCSYEPSLTLP